MTAAAYHPCHIFFFFFNDTATTEIYTLSLHDALPICLRHDVEDPSERRRPPQLSRRADRKSTRLNSSHLGISYAVFCLKKKKNPLPLHVDLIFIVAPALKKSILISSPSL